jgi:hypothetical protein
MTLAITIVFIVLYLFINKFSIFHFTKFYSFLLTLKFYITAHNNFYNLRNFGKNESLITYNKNLGNVVFIKTHKTCSSTLSGIIWREMCEKQNLNCFLPHFKNPGKTWDLNKIVDLEYILNNPGSNGNFYPYDCWMHHVKYNFILTKIVKNPFLFVSIIRKPSLRFLSAWHWYKLYKKLDNITLDTFINIMLKQQGNNKVNNLLRKKLNKKLKYRTGLNSYSEELIGFREIENPKKFKLLYKQLLMKVKNNEIFLLICDRFDESIIIFKKIMNWHSFNSILYFKQKVACKNENKNNALNTSIKLLNNLNNIQKYDLKLYYIADAILNKHIDMYNKTLFQKDLQYFIKKLYKTQYYCNKILVENNSKIFFSKKNSSKRTCYEKNELKKFNLNNKTTTIDTEIDLKLRKVQIYENSMILFTKKNTSDNDKYGYSVCESLLRDNKEIIYNMWHKNKSKL